MIAAAVAGLFAAASCQKEGVPASGEVKVSFTVALPDALDTKAIAQAGNADIVYYEIWSADWSKQLYPVDNNALASEEVVEKKATIDLVLVVDQTYNFIFWAQNEACGAYDVNELQNVRIDYGVMAGQGNQDKFDAFYAVKAIAVDGPVNETITLKRPFSQLNFGASKMDSSFGPITVGATSVTVDGLATTFNTVSGVGTDAAAPVTFEANGLATDASLVTGGNSYAWVTMDYMCMMDVKSTVDVTADIEVEGVGTVHHEITYVPIQRNYRTNIVGDLFTSNAHLDIIVDPAFEDPDIVLNIVENNDALNAAIKNGELEIALTDGTYSLTNVPSGLKLIGVGDNVVLDVQNKVYGVNGAVSFENVTIRFSNANYKGFQHTSQEYYKDCTIIGQPFLYGDAVVFEDCTFEQESADAYNVWTYGAKEVTFEGCTFNSAGKSVLVYAEGSSAGSEVTFNDCELNASAPVEGKAAIEIDSSLIKGEYLVNINDTQANGFANGNVSGNSLWNNKKGAKTKVFVDGAQVL